MTIIKNNLCRYHTVRLFFNLNIWLVHCLYLIDACNIVRKISVDIISNLNITDFITLGFLYQQVLYSPQH